MKRVKKSSRVCWPTEANLCQVKIFQSEDCPSEVGSLPPGNPEENISNANVAVSDGCPGSSVGSYPDRLSHKDVSHIPQIPWRTPPRFDLKFKCRVAAGEESEELEVQKHREMREREAVYPHFSAVPPCPSISSDVEAEHFDDWHTPVIPVIPIEEAAETDWLYNKTAGLNISMKSEPAKAPQSSSPSEIFDTPQSKPRLSLEPSNSIKSDHAPLQDLDGPIVAAAAATTTAIMKSKEPGCVIDSDLLIQLLSNPKLFQKLIDEHRLASDTTTGTSGSRMVESSVRCPSPKGGFLFEESTIEGCKPNNPGTEFIHRASRVRDSPAAPSRIRAQVASTETGPASAWDKVEQSLHFQSPTLIPLVQKRTTENIQPGNAGIEALLRPGNQPLAAKAEMGTGLGPKQVTTSVSLLSSKSDLAIQNSNYEDFQTADAGNMSFLRASDTLSSSTPDVLSQKSYGKHVQLADDGHMAVPRAVKRVPATNIEVGAGSRSRTMAPLVPLPSSKSDLTSQNSNYVDCQAADAGNMSFLKASDTLSSSTPDVLSQRSAGRHDQLADNGHMAVPRAVKRAPASNIEVGAGSRSRTVAPLVPLLSSNPDFPGNNFMKEQSQVANFRDLSIPRFVKPSLAGSTISRTAFEAKQVAPSIPLSRVLPDFSKKSSREHGPLLYTSFPEPAMEKHSHTFHQMQGEPSIDQLVAAYMAPHLGTSLPFGAPAIPESSLTTDPLAKLYLLKKLIAEHGSDDRAGNDYVGGPLPNIFSGMMEPLKKDISYFQSLIKQHGEEKESQDAQLSHGISLSHVQSKESDLKYKKTCKFYNSSKGCRNGSSCHYQHDIPGRSRSDVVLEAPGAKRAKLGETFTGRT